MNDVWRTDEAPKDGTEFVAIGRVLWQDEVSGGSMPFVAAIRWKRVKTALTEVKRGTLPMKKI